MRYIVIPSLLNEDLHPADKNDLKAVNHPANSGGLQ